MCASFMQVRERKDCLFCLSFHCPLLSTSNCSLSMFPQSLRHIICLLINLPYLLFYEKTKLQSVFFEQRVALGAFCNKIYSVGVQFY